MLFSRQQLGRCDHEAVATSSGCTSASRPSRSRANFQVAAKVTTIIYSLVKEVINPPPTLTGKVFSRAPEFVPFSDKDPEGPSAPGRLCGNSPTLGTHLPAPESRPPPAALRTEHKHLLSGDEDGGCGVGGAALGQAAIFSASHAFVKARVDACSKLRLTLETREETSLVLSWLPSLS